MVLKFYTGRYGKVISRLQDGKIVLPARGFAPEDGEEWEVRLEEKDRFCIAFPIERVEREEVVVSGWDVMIIRKSGSKVINREEAGKVFEWCDEGVRVIFLHPRTKEVLHIRVSRPPSGDDSDISAWGSWAESAAGTLPPRFAKMVLEARERLQRKEREKEEAIREAEKYLQYIEQLLSEIPKPPVCSLPQPRYAVRFVTRFFENRSEIPPDAKEVREAEWTEERGDEDGGLFWNSRSWWGIEPRFKKIKGWVATVPETYIENDGEIFKAKIEYYDKCREWFKALPLSVRLALIRHFYPAYDTWEKALTALEVSEGSIAARLATEIAKR